MALLTLKRKLKSELRLKTADSKWEFHRDGPRLKVSMGVDRDNLTRTSWNTFQSHQKERTELERPEYCPSVFVNPDTGAVRMAYREMVIRFESQTSARRQHQILRKYGLKIREGKPKVANQLTVYDPQRKIFGYGLIQTANACAAEDEVLFATPNFLSEFRRDSTPSRMPIAADLWHLDMIQVRQAWNHTQGRDRNARSVIVAVLDDGVETGHPNLSPNIVAGGRDFFLNEGEPGHLDPGPKSFRAPFFSSNGNDIHGTACAGVAELHVAPRRGAELHAGEKPSRFEPQGCNGTAAGSPRHDSPQLFRAVWALGARRAGSTGHPSLAPASARRRGSRAVGPG